MSVTSSFFPFYIVIVGCNEFFIKSLFESWYGQVKLSRMKRTYFLYRVAVFIAHGCLLSFFFQLPPAPAALIAGTLAFIGCTELIAASLSNAVFVRTGRPLKGLHLLYMAIFAAAVLLVWKVRPWQPGIAFKLLDFFGLGPASWQGYRDIFATLLVYFIASIPANYAIRWLLNKPEDPTWADIVAGEALYAKPGEQPTAHHQIAPTAEATASPTLKGGRIVGVLERWIVIALLSRGEMAAIGFIFTAKSIARYRDFNKPDFTEYYLIGTLYSVIIALALSTLL